MNYKKTVLVVLVGICCQVFLFSISHAQTTQVISGQINADLSALVDHSLPLDTNQYNNIDYIIPNDVGIMGINYSFLNAYDNSGPAIVTSKGNLKYNLKFNKDYMGVQSMHVKYNVPPAFVSPVFIGYDFSPVLDEIFLIKPALDLSYPANLELISSNPTYTGVNPIHIEYADKHNGLIEVNFLRKPLPADYIRSDVGMFTIIGKPSQVDRLKRIAGNLKFLPDSMRQMLGVFDLDRIYLIVADFSGKGHFFSEVGAFRRSDNIFIIDPTNFTSEASDITFGEMIIHEITHSIVYRNTYNKEEKFAPWFDEGMSVFAAQTLGEKYLGDTEYYISPGPDGSPWVWQELFQRFSEKQLLDRYNKNFDFDVPAEGLNGNLDNINDFYTHTGIVIKNFYLKVGDQGMRTFMKRMSQFHSCGYTKDQCDTNKIIALMSELSGLTRDQLLFPYKGDSDFKNKIKPLIRNKLTQDQTDKILDEYNVKIKPKIESIKKVSTTKKVSATTPTEDSTIVTPNIPVKKQSFWTNMKSWFLRIF